MTGEQLISNGKWDEFVLGKYGKHVTNLFDGQWKVYELRDQRNGKFCAVNKYKVLIHADDIDALKRKIKETVGALSYKSQE